MIIVSVSCTITLTYTIMQPDVLQRLGITPLKHVASNTLYENFILVQVHNHYIKEKVLKSFMSACNVFTSHKNC